MSIADYIAKIAKRAKDASIVLANTDTAQKNNALERMAENLISDAGLILKANDLDINCAKKKNRTSAFLEKLQLNHKRIKDMAGGIRQVATLDDPVGQVIKKWQRPNGLMISKLRVPIGVIGIIYESRPNVTSDCASLCLKSSNSIILRGGSESIHSNVAISKALVKALVKTGLPEGAINMIGITDRKAVDILLKQVGLVDLVIPRGGEGLIKEVTAKSQIPVIKHYKGVCHVFVDEYADLGMAEKISFNAKCQRPGVCNAMETLLVHKNIAKKFLPVIAARFKEANVELRGCPKTRMIVKGVRRAAEADWYTEYLDLVLSVRVVDDLDEAIGHIRKYGSMHSDAIVTENTENAGEFLKRVDSACVYVNASTRFTDGYQFGMGAEIGISTDKIHARGPMGLEELCSYKYAVWGDGQIRE